MDAMMSLCNVQSENQKNNNYYYYVWFNLRKKKKLLPWRWRNFTKFDDVVKTYLAFGSADALRIWFYEEDTNDIRGKTLGLFDFK